MKQSLFALLVAIWVMAGSLWAQVVNNLDDLNYWGTGPNRAAFVVYWNDSKSPDALAWGYKWSGTQTVADMLLFLANADPLLFARIDSATGFGVAVFGIGYQNGNAPFSIVGAQDINGNPVIPSFLNGIDDLNTNPTTTQAPASSTAAAPADSQDRYKEGWNDNGFWQLFHSGTDSFNLQPFYSLPTTWTSSFVGSGVTLVNEAWAAFSISNPDFTSNPPTSNVVAAIPEPSSLLLLGLGSVWLVLRRKKV